LTFIEFALLAGADPGLVTSLAQPKKPQATALPPPDEPGATRHPCASALRIQQSKMVDGGRDCCSSMSNAVHSSGIEPECRHHCC
jgi:hypothetical protein